MEEEVKVEVYPGLSHDLKFSGGQKAWKDLRMSCRLVMGLLPGPQNS